MSKALEAAISGNVSTCAVVTRNATVITSHMPGITSVPLAAGSAVKVYAMACVDVVGCSEAAAFAVGREARRS